MRIVPTTEYMPASGQGEEKQRDRSASKQNSRQSIQDGMDAFDQAYSTRLSVLLGDENPRGAYDHIRNSGLYDETVKIAGYIFIYSWLYRELSITDAHLVKKGFAGKITKLLGKLGRDNTPSYQALTEELEKQISTWFQIRITEANYHKIGSGLAIPTGYASLAAKTPEGSPLRGQLSAIIQTPIEEIEMV